ncbi:hypothetical protein SMICM17S_02870 [Streptomyces microflavus]
MSRAEGAALRESAVSASASRSSVSGKAVFSGTSRLAPAAVPGGDQRLYRPAAPRAAASRTGAGAR